MTERNPALEKLNLWCRMNYKDTPFNVNDPFGSILRKIDENPELAVEVKKMLMEKKRSRFRSLMARCRSFIKGRKS